MSEEASKPEAVPPPLRSLHTPTFAELLTKAGSALAISTYQAGKLVFARADGGVVNTHFRNFDRPMGIATERGRLAVGTSNSVWEFHDQPDAARKLEPSGKHDACYLPRVASVTGDIKIHEIHYGRGGLWVVNTLFSCLCTLDGVHSFVPRWRPPFVKALAPEDRCHLNGLALVDGQPAFATAMGPSDTAGGWRERKADGGCVIELASGAVICEGLAMPHSPRWHDGALWVLDSGRGALCRVDAARKRAEPVAQLPGFTRGLDFVGPYALVGLSHARERAWFGDLPITRDDFKRQCGVWIVDTRDGREAGRLQFEDAVQEVFEVRVLHGQRYPDLLNEDRERIGTTYALPEEALKDLDARYREGSDPSPKGS